MNEAKQSDPAKFGSHVPTNDYIRGWNEALDSAERWCREREQDWGLCGSWDEGQPLTCTPENAKMESFEACANMIQKMKLCLSPSLANPPHKQQTENNNNDNSNSNPSGDMPDNRVEITHLYLSSMENLWNCASEFFNRAFVRETIGKITWPDEAITRDFLNLGDAIERVDEVKEIAIKNGTDGYGG